MKKVITALLNKTVNDKLKEYEEIKVAMNDIQYQEGIIEAIEIDPQIEYIILSELLPGELNIKNLIEKIKQIKSEIKIIIILEKENKELENYLLSKGNINIFYNNEIKIKEIAELIINKNKEEKLELEIKKLKEIIMDNNTNKNNEKIILKNNLIEKEENKNIITLTENEKIKIEEEIEKEYNENLNKNKLLNLKIIKKLFFKEKIENNSKLIIVSGIGGVGKSVFTVNLAKTLEKQKSNILIIDLDFLNNSIQTLFGIKIKKENERNKLKNINDINNNTKKINYIENVERINYIEKFNNKEKIYNMPKEITIEELTIKINSNIKLISNINLIFSKDEINDLELIKIIKEIKQKYDFIIIDTDINNKYLKSITEETHKIIFITEPNILQIKKSKNILERNFYLNEIEKEKLYILFNKVKSDSISFNILKEVFKNYNIIGKINFIKNCNILINQNMKSIFLESKIKNQYKKIAKKISQDNKIKNYYLDKIEE